VAEGAAGELLSLPMFPGMRPDELERTADALRAALAR
jgi:dTDP-4-amino-4,6-dideoxygalactose transaminase